MERAIIRIGNVADIGRGSSPRPIIDKKYFENGEIPWIKIADATASGKYIYKTKEYVNDVGAAHSRKMKPGTLILSASGSLGIPHFLGVEGCIHDGWIYMDNIHDIDKQYLYYLLLTMRPYFNNLSYGAAIQNINTSILSKTKIEVPDMQSQEKIGLMLSTYDNLIENNNKRIKLLEQMIENLYKEWFVRFRFPGYENTKFVDGIPSDWKILRMSDLCYVTDGTHDTPKPVNDGGVPLVTGKCIKNGFIDFNEPYNISYQDHESISKRSGLQTGDILFSNIGTVGTTCLVNYDREFSVKNVIIFKPDNIKVSNYLYSWLNSDSIQAIFATQTNGASQQFVGLNFMRRFKILVPNANVLDLYSDRIKPIRTEIVKLHDINENLIKQRDMLLPRLMSGKLEV